MPHDANPRERRFVDEYLIDLCAARAYVRAGYTAKNMNVAAVEGHRLLRRPKVAAAISAAQKARSERTELAQDYVLARLTAVAEKAEGLRPVRRSIRVGEGDDGAPQFIEFEQTVFNPAAAKAAYELLGKHLGMFVERREHSVRGAAGPIALRFDAMEPEQLEALIHREFERREAEGDQCINAKEGQNQRDRLH